jgi:hypothetical protein
MFNIQTVYVQLTQWIYVFDYSPYSLIRFMTRSQRGYYSVQNESLNGNEVTLVLQKQLRLFLVFKRLTELSLTTLFQLHELSRP